MQQLIEKQPPQPCAALVVDDLAGKAGRIDRRTLEILVPVIPLAHQAPLHILLPERRPAIDTEPVEPERIQRKPGRKVERGLHVLDRLVRIADREEPVHDLNARSFGVHDRGVHLRQRLLFFQPVEYLLAAALDAEHDGAAVGLGHCRKQVLGD